MLKKIDSFLLTTLGLLPLLVILYVFIFSDRSLTLVSFTSPQSLSSNVNKDLPLSKGEVRSGIVHALDNHLGIISIRFDTLLKKSRGAIIFKIKDSSAKRW